MLDFVETLLVLTELVLFFDFVEPLDVCESFESCETSDASEPLDLPETLQLLPRDLTEGADPKDASLPPRESPPDFLNSSRSFSGVSLGGVCGDLVDKDRLEGGLEPGLELGLELGLEVGLEPPLAAPVLEGTDDRLLEGVEPRVTAVPLEPRDPARDEEREEPSLPPHPPLPIHLDATMHPLYELMGSMLVVSDLDLLMWRLVGEVLTTCPTCVVMVSMLVVRDLDLVNCLLQGVLLLGGSGDISGW